MTSQMELCGILPVYKPAGYTSFDVIARLRGILHLKKLGHGGTLDPMAEGVLPVFVGSATKLVDFVPEGDKTYRATIRFGAFSDTGDKTGSLEAAALPDFSVEQLQAAAREMEGESLQIPPMYSAVKVNGRKLYDLARAGITVERQARKIFVHRFLILSYEEETKTAVAEIRCSKGSYVRVLAEDLAKKCGTGAYLTGLVRTEAMGFTEADCHTPDEIKSAVEAGRLSDLLLSAERPFSGAYGVCLNSRQEKLFRNGSKLPLSELQDVFGKEPKFEDSPLPVFGETGLLGMGERREEEDVMRIRRLFHLQKETE